MKQTPFGVVLRLVVAAAFAAPLSVNAIEIQSGTSVKLTFGDCEDLACNTIYYVDSAVSGDPGDLAASASDSRAGYGAASAAVSLSGEIGAPVLRATATSELVPYTRVSTNSIAIQRYTYQGTEVTQRTFGAVLAYSQFISPDVLSGVLGQIEVFTLTSEFFEVGTTPESNFDALFFRFPLDEPGSGYVSLGTDTFQDPATALSGTGTLGVPVTLSPGDSVWVWALLQTPVVNGSNIDAFNTFVTGWDDATDLVPANVVPAPPAVWLLGTGLAGLGGRRWLKRKISG